MKKIVIVGASVMASLLLVMVVYTACGENVSDSVPTTCERPVAYSTMAEIEAMQIQLFSQWLAQTGTVLTPDQEAQLSNQGDLVGVFTDQLTRPVKFDNGMVDMPSNWLPELPPGHPWHTAPESSEPTFAAWFEVRIVNPLLYDPTKWQHVEWAEAYLNATQNETDLTSLAGTDSGCP